MSVLFINKLRALLLLKLGHEKLFLAGENGILGYV